MKFLILAVFWLSNLQLGYSQSNKGTMDIIDIVHNEKVIIDWIKKDFQPDDTTTLEKVVDFHPILVDGTNRKLAVSPALFSFCKLPLEMAYANYREGNKFSVHLLINLDTNKIELLKDGLGLPDNVTDEDWKNRDFDFLAWKKGSTWISVLKNYIAQQDLRVPSSKRYSLYIVTISNAAHGELPKAEPISTE